MFIVLTIGQLCYLSVLCISFSQPCEGKCSFHQSADKETKTEVR